MKNREKGKSNFQGTTAASDNPPSSDRSITQILQEILNRATDIIRSEIRLARTEVRQDVAAYARASVYLVSAGALSLYALGFVLLAVVYALAITMQAWLAATSCWCLRWNCCSRVVFYGS